MADEITPTSEEEVTTEITADAKPAAKAPRSKKAKRSVPAGQLHVQSTFNNTIISFTDKKGNVLTQSSAGATGFRGSKKGTAYAAQVASEKATEVAKTQFGMNTVDVFVKGVGIGRDAAIRALETFEISIDSIKEVTGVPHGGVRPRKARRG